MAGDNIDAIQVSLGIDQTRLRSDLRAVKAEFDRNVPKDRTVNVHVKLFTDQHAINQMFKGLRAQISNLNRAGGPEAFRVVPQMRMDRRGLNEFRRDTEIQLRRSAQAGAPIHIPIKPAFNSRQFQADILALLGGPVEIPVRGKFMGWSPGGAPPSGFGGGGGGAPTPGPRAFGGGGTAAPRPTPAPPPATARPARSPTARQMAGGVEARSADVYQVPEAPRAARAARARPAPAGPVYGPPAPFTPYGGGARTRGARVTPGYVEPAGGRVTMGNVRGGGTVSELQGEEREAFMRQQRALGRTDYSPNLAPQATGRIRGRPTTPAAIERLERRRRFQAGVVRGQSPQDIAAREALRSGFHSVSPSLAASFDQLTDPESSFDYPQFEAAAKSSRQAWIESRPQDKKARRQSRILMGHARGDVSDVDPMLLTFDAALKAARQEAETAMNPLAVIQKGDTSRRGRGGKVGQVGSRGAGRLASETIEPAAINEIMRRRRVGGRGNGWKALGSEYSSAEIREAQRRLNINKGRLEPIAPIQEGAAYGGGGEYVAEGTAPAIPGGQGMFRQEKRTAGGGTGGGVSVGEQIARETWAPSPRRYGWQERQIRERWMARRAARPFGPFLPGPPRFAEGGWLEYAAEGSSRRPQYGPFLGLDLAADIPGRAISGAFGERAGRKGSALRLAQEQRLRAGIKNRLERERKPLYMQGGQSDPRQVAARNQFLAERRGLPNGLRCAVCGRPTIEGDRGGIGTTVDHVRSTAQGGDIYDPKNFQVLCRTHNSLKSGGRMARQVPVFAGPGFAEGGNLKWSGLSSSRGGIRRARMVGERGPEIEVEGHNGETEIIPAHQTQSWLSRHANGGFQMRGARGPRAATEARLSSGVVAAGDITRVFVVNWPKGMGLGGPGPAIADPSQAKAAAKEAAAAARALSAQQAEGAGPATGVGGATVTGAVPGGRRIRGLGASPLEKVRAQRRAFEQGEDIEDTLSRARSNITEAMQLSPVRALSVAFGQIAQTAIGGRAGILRRRDIAQRQLRVAGREEGRLTGLRTERERLLEENRGIRTGKTDVAPEDRAAAIRANQAQLAELRPAIREQAGIAGARAAEAEAASKKILSTKQQFVGQAVGLGGIVAGTAVFTAAMTAFQTASEAASQALAPLIDQTLGWSQSLETASRAMSEQIQQTRAVGGREEAIAARAIAGGGGITAGLGAVGARAEAQAASRIAAIGLENAKAGIGAGGADNALFAGTGGLFGGAFLSEQLGGQLGFMENINKRIGVTAPVRSMTAGGARTAAGTVNRANPALEQRIGARAEGRVSAIADFNAALGRAATAVGEDTAAFELHTKEAVANTKEFERLKTAMITSTQTTDERNAAEKMASQGVVVTARGGGALAPGGFRRATEELARGTVIPDLPAFIRQNATQRRAQLNAINLQAQARREEDLPAQFAFGRIAQPPRRFGTTFSTVGADARTQQNMARDLRLVADAAKVTAPADKRGADALETIVERTDPARGPQVSQATGFTTGQRGAGPNLTAFRGLVGQVRQLGGDIQQRQMDVTARQVALQTHEYENQLRITKRSLGDAEDLYAAINGNVSDTLGGLQGQNIMLDRQNQLLSRRAQRLAFRSEDIGFKQSDLQMRAQQMQFDMAQRQINFQKAVAGFTAPGLTPEERAARINEAKVEADFAQRQLNIQIQIAKMAREQLAIAKAQAGVQREIFGNQVAQQENAFAIQREEARRNVQDIAADLAIMQENRQVTIDTASAEEAIERLRIAQGLLIEEAQTYVTQGQEIRGGILDEVARANAITSQGFTVLVASITGAWQAAADSYITNFVTPVMASLQSTGIARADTRPGSGATEHQRGIITTTAGPTQFLAGEAGDEHVIVLRNPTKGTMLGGGFGGGGINVGGITIIVQGGNEQDADKLAAAIERRISTKLALIAGGRP
jgi:hypothetical protein